MFTLLNKWEKGIVTVTVYSSLYVYAITYIAHCIYVLGYMYECEYNILKKIHYILTVVITG